MVGKGGHTPPFPGQPPLPKITPFLEIQDVLPLTDLSGKQKYWINLLTNLYIYSTYKVS